VFRIEALNLAVEDGVGAAQILSQPDALPLALLDWMMPGLNGVDVVRAESP
jgi:CheY-like chemotaxis protein